jgi:ElaB/YqjD/DUF883 family membrane-anchored ribosome-binding protein
MSETSKTPKNLGEAIEHLEGTEKSRPRSQIETEIEQLKKTLDELTQKAKVSLDEGVDSAKELGREVDRRVHENPWMAIGIVGFVAFLIGLLIGRKD